MADIYYAYNGLLCTLQVLHCIWFYMIMRMLYFYVIKGEVACVTLPHVCWRAFSAYCLKKVKARTDRRNWTDTL